MRPQFQLYVHLSYKCHTPALVRPKDPSSSTSLALPTKRGRGRIFSNPSAELTG